jgi:hypothetical protein
MGSSGVAYARRVATLLHIWVMEGFSCNRVATRTKEGRARYRVGEKGIDQGKRGTQYANAQAFTIRMISIPWHARTAYDRRTVCGRIDFFGKLRDSHFESGLNLLQDLLVLICCYVSDPLLRQ